MPGTKLGFSPPIGESFGWQTHVSPKSKDNLPTGIDREKERALPPGSATPNAPAKSDDTTSKGQGGRSLPKFEENTPDSGSGISERPRSLPTPGEQWGNPTKFDYGTPTRRIMDRVAELLLEAEHDIEAYKARPRGKHQRRQRGISKVRRQQRYRRNRSKEKRRAKMHRKKNRNNSSFKRVNRHRTKFPGQHKRRGSPADPVLVAAFYLEAPDWNPPQQVPPSKKQQRQRGEEKQQSKDEYEGERSEHKREMSERHKRLMKKDKFRDYKQWYNEQYRQRGERGFRRRGEVLTSPQISFVIGKSMEGGTVHNVSPMTGMVTFVLDDGRIHSLPVMAFLHAVVFLSDDDIDAMFELIDVEVGEEAYTEIDEHDVRECARLFDVDPDAQEFADRCQALVGQSELSRMAPSELDQVNDELVVGVLEGGGRERPAPEDEDPEGVADEYDWHLYYGEVPNPGGRTAGARFYRIQPLGKPLRESKDWNGRPLEGGGMFVFTSLRELQDTVGMWRPSELDDTEVVEIGYSGKVWDHPTEHGTLIDPKRARITKRLPTSRVVKRAYADTFLFDQEGPEKQEINYPGSNVNHNPTGPKHHKWEPRDRDLPKGETGPDKHLDDVPAGSGRVVPNGEGQLWSGDATYLKAAALIDEIAQRTGQDVHSRARAVSIRVYRSDPGRGVWLFQAQGRRGTYRIRIKGLRKGNVRALAKAQVKVSCSCGFFRWQGPEHWAKANGYLYGRPVGSASFPKVRDPDERHWACKHVLAALNLARNYRFGSNTTWLTGEVELVPDYAVMADHVAGRYLDSSPMAPSE